MDRRGRGKAQGGGQVKIKTVLVANRGEIACRLIRAAHSVGAKAAAVYSDADRFSAHADAADCALRIGPPPPSESYLNIAALIRAAKECGADAVSPGCGFLSESPEFARACEKAGLIFVGPSSRTMALAASKSAARETAMRAGVPVAPGFFRAGAGDRQLARAAEKLGFPLFIKALAGGGGRGMRLADNAKKFPEALAAARREAKSAFGDDAVFLERFIPRARHLEAQILADNFGQIRILGERDCSWQRRNQKMIEEAPAPNLSADLRDELRRHAHALAKATAYRNAGTAEFLLDMDSGRLFFLEINARLQVEHPVTEMIFGQDLAAWQLRIAAGERLPKEDFSADGWAMEARVCAEDPLNDFLPAVGVVSGCEWPRGDGIRVDAGIRAGDRIGGHYDSLAAKIIARGKTREEARLKLAAALSQTRMSGPANNLSFLRALVSAPEFIGGNVTVGLFAHARESLLSSARARRTRLEKAAVAALCLRAARRFPAAGFRLNQPPRALANTGARQWEVTPAGAESFRARCGEERFSAAALRETNDGLQGELDGEFFAAEIRRAGAALSVFMDGDSADFRPDESTATDKKTSATESDGIARAPMHAFVRTVSAKPGDIVARGDSLMTLEAMKMEIPVPAPRDGAVVKILAAENDAVAEGAPLAEIDDGSKSKAASKSGGRRGKG